MTNVPTDSSTGGSLCRNTVRDCGQKQRCSYLKHDGEEDDHNRRGHKKVFGFDVFTVQQHHQCKRHRPSQATVRHHHLVDLIQRDEPETVQNPGLTDHTWSTEVNKGQDDIHIW